MATKARDSRVVHFLDLDFIPQHDDVRKRHPGIEAFLKCCASRLLCLLAAHLAGILGTRVLSPQEMQVAQVQES